MAAEKAAQYASRNNELEQRVRVLEQIVTDGGAQTAAQIEALRRRDRRRRTLTRAADARVRLKVRPTCNASWMIQQAGSGC